MNLSPIIEDKGYIGLGNSENLIVYCCKKDLRNEPKKDAKGKPIP